jgi:hypothetical protein
MEPGEVPAVSVHAEPASASGSAGPDDDLTAETGDDNDGLD